MIYLKAIMWAIVEGATEFIPVSSTGHLIILGDLLPLGTRREFSDAFLVIIQLPAILAVAAYFLRELWPFHADRSVQRQRFALWSKILAAFFPAAFFGALLGDYIEERLFSATPVAIALVLGGIVLLVIEQQPRLPRLTTVADIPLRAAIGIGLFQCFAMFPGTSRSAATIIGAMLLGASRSAAAEFSFFLAIPTMVAATGYEMMKHGLSFSAAEWRVLALGSLVSFIVAYAVVAAFMGYIRHKNFKIFGYYRIALGLAVLVYFHLLS